MTEQYPGRLDATAIFEDGQQVGVRVDRADPLVDVPLALLESRLAPGVVLYGTLLTIEAVNGTWRYLLEESGAGRQRTYLGRLIESPAEPPTDVLSTPGVQDSPCGPVEAGICDCCGRSAAAECACPDACGCVGAKDR